METRFVYDNLFICELLMVNKRDKVFKNGPSKICERQPLSLHIF